MPDHVDTDLLRRFVHGDRDAFESLFRRFEIEVYRWSLAIVRDASMAEDVVVEARDHLRAARRRAIWTRPIVDEVSAPGDADSGVAEAVALALRRLPPKLQVVAALALIEERSYAEIADALELPVGTVKSRVFRAIRALREELARLGVQP